MIEFEVQFLFHKARHRRQRNQERNRKEEHGENFGERRYLAHIGFHTVKCRGIAAPAIDPACALQRVHRFLRGFDLLIHCLQHRLLFARIRMDLVVNTLTVRAYRQGKISVFGGDQFRPLLHVRDAARAAVDNLATKPTGVFNLARQNVRIVDLAYQVRNHFPDLVLEQTPMKFQDARNYRVSSEKAQKTLGFKATYSIDDGIDQIKELLESHRLRDVDNPRYTNQTFLSMFNTHRLIAGRGEG